eukprot:a849617_5.p1 GENE.a849617_5~~a849617_5.p1  ORF type:complete len:322 (-),score=105.24 a849617_5:37-975(-)
MAVSLCRFLLAKRVTAAAAPSATGSPSASRVRVGALVGTDRVLDLTALSPQFAKQSWSLSDDGLAAAEALVASDGAKRSIPLDEIRFLPPVVASKVLGIGLNYRDHVAETAMKLPSEPLVFAKMPSSLVGHRGFVVRPPRSTKVDFEGELVVVMGSRLARAASEADAMRAIAGFSVGNDITARDFQFEWGGGQFTLSKSADTFAPLGPAMVSKAALARAGLSASDLAIETRLNGSVMQSSRTSEMIFSPAHIVAYLSQLMTLLPGDVVFTGTPPGVGMARTPPVFLKARDKLAVEIEGLGILSNLVIDAPKS